MKRIEEKIEETPQYLLYTDKELVPGAKHWGLTVAQERERIRLLQANPKNWPSGLRHFLSMVQPKDFPGIPTSPVDVMQWAIVKWLRKQDK